ncbi:MULTISPECIES: tetratricopeptide repeat protein [Catenuloplanes]|uniref:Tetratricopeptide (TPR) repeat protein n=1 Tax=Catenuloplanes niger TaxID=587534 RepID=A0AAE3ZJU6_9ACTN|nr:tetratricopeptide repeat protein [Catenuloplanes niger]MDR7321259.1 tetratricopeptide (TPR) repeat protein [Catenuloplanes niger]
MRGAEPPPDPARFADLIVEWSGLVLAGFALLMTVMTIIFVAAGFLGIREVRSIRAIRLRARLEQEVQRSIANDVIDRGNQAVLTGEQLADVSQSLLAEARRSVEHITDALQKVEEQAARVAEMEARLQDSLADFDGRLSRQVEVNYLFARGEDSYNRSRYTRAIEFWKRAAEVDPQNGRVRYRMGRALTNIGDDKRALAHLEAAIERGIPEDLGERGLALFYRYSKPERAFRHALRATEINGESSEHWDLLGLLYRDSGDFVRSREAHGKAEAVGDEPVVPPFFLALLEAQANAIQRARGCSERAVQRLDRSDDGAPVRFLWASTIRWADAVLRADYDRADRHAAELRDSGITARRAHEVCDHMDFLLRALGREEHRRRYVEPIEQQAMRR